MTNIKKFVIIFIETKESMKERYHMTKVTYIAKTRDNKVVKTTDYSEVIKLKKRGASVTTRYEKIPEPVHIFGFGVKAVNASDYRPIV